MDTFQQLGISLGMGLLVGLQRQRSDSALAGVRTFPLITIFGTLCALLAKHFGGGTIVVGFLALAGLIVVGNLAKQKLKAPDPGLTTEVAILVMFGMGAYIVVGPATIALVVCSLIVVLLHLKPQLHSFSERIGEEDFRAIMQFVVIALVILPVLPNETYGPYDVLNPFKIWLLVVFIVGMSIAGYVAYKLFGAGAGAIIGGILGGLISSTATTVSYSRQSKSHPKLASLSGLVIAIASTVVFGRVLAIVGLAAPHMLLQVGLPLMVMLGVLALGVAVMFFLSHREKKSMPEQKNPSELKSALVFAGMFAVVLIAVAFAKDKFGNSGLYIVGVLSGLTDMDAITLSTVQMLQGKQLGADTAWRLILIASMANLVFKIGIVVALGNRELLWRAGGFFAFAFVVGTLILIFWPEAQAAASAGGLAPTPSPTNAPAATNFLPVRPIPAQ